VVAVSERASVQRSMEVAMQGTPRMKLSFIAFPGSSFSSPHHTTFFMRGSEPFTSKLLQPVLVDARTAKVTAAPKMPWYLTGLLVSQPLHFGDYGGMPMQILWALLDITTLVVLGSGLYLWLKRGKAAPAPTPATPASTARGREPEAAAAVKAQA
jgi:uncharacterized iron-regulated membrane protein